MNLTETEIKQYTKRLLKSRLRILCNNAFFGLLLMHMKFSLDDVSATAGTDGEYIHFFPDFLNLLSDSELDFIMMHEILHVALKHVFRGAKLDKELYNKACDIVVNSIILDVNNNNIASIMVLGIRSHHIAPNGKEGRLYSAEEVYAMMLGNEESDTGTITDDEQCPKIDFPSGSKKISEAIGNKEFRDDHSRWEDNNDDDSIGKKEFQDDHSRWADGNDDDFMMTEKWDKYIMDAANSIEIRDPGNSCGTVPGCFERLIKELKEPQIDWHTILNEFVQEEITDYSFSPPDRRFDETPFFLPDFNEPEDIVKDVLFMIDTSGSMSDEMVTAVYSEVKGAVDQFGGKLKGWLGFFDSIVYEPTEFCDVESLSEIKMYGGGGTSFKIIFNYIRNEMQDNLPVSIIILTDGYAEFPDESMAMGIPVLWLIVTDDRFSDSNPVEVPWGKVARITSFSYSSLDDF